MDMFELNRKREMENNAPLASKMRPDRLEDYFGQDHIVGVGKPLYRMVKADRLSSLILYGPPGSGKTTLAKIIANETDMEFQEISAVVAGKKELKELIDQAESDLALYSKKTIVFIDEIHRFNKLQQDLLLPFVESGLIILIGATTENPYFEVNKALLSRCQIVELRPLSDEALKKVIERALKDKDKGYGNTPIDISDEAIDYLVRSSNRDARSALNSLEIAILTGDKKDGKIFIGPDDIRDSIIKKTSYYDKDGDSHYDIISAFIKSMRGSDPDAAIYYLARMLEAGEDIKFIARRIMILASEDIGLADPNAMNIANSCFQSINVIGMPEARIILANAVLYMALAPKSNSAYLAIDDALSFVRNGGSGDVPLYLRDAHYSGAKALDHGKGYKYPHNFKYAYVKQGYLPKNIENKSFYRPKNMGYELKLINRLNKLKEIEE